jgi:nucleoid-associated protein YgaU
MSNEVIPAPLLPIRDKQPLTGGVARLLLGAWGAGLISLASVLPLPAEVFSWLSVSGSAPASATTTLDRLVLGCVSIVIWVLILWSAALLVIGVVFLRNGTTSGAKHVLARMLPKSARTVVLTAVGAGSVLALSACAPAGASASGTGEAAGVAAASSGALSANSIAVDWPTLSDAPRSTFGSSDPFSGFELDVDWPSEPILLPTAATSSLLPEVPTIPPAAPPTPEVPHAAAEPTAAEVPEAELPESVSSSDLSVSPDQEFLIVQPGDTLWSIAQAALPPDATATDIAAEWPRWYAANAPLIGPDPDLLRPGWQLVRPHQAKESSP